MQSFCIDAKTCKTACCSFIGSVTLIAARASNESAELHGQPGAGVYASLHSRREVKHTGTGWASSTPCLIGWR